MSKRFPYKEDIGPYFFVSNKKKKKLEKNALKSLFCFT